MIFLPSHSLEKYPGKVSGLQKQADELQTKGYYDKTIPIIKEVLASRREASGGSNAEVAKSLHFGILYALLAEYAKAEFFLFNHLNKFFRLID